MDGGDYASIIAAIIALISTLAVARSSGKANRLAKELESKALVDAKEIEANASKESVRSQAETDAYERARAFDTETITRQAAKIDALEATLAERESELGQVRTENGLVHADNRMINGENRDLQQELASCHRVIENLRNYIRHNPDALGGEVPAELEEAPPPTPKPEVDIHVRRVIEEVVDEGYTEPGNSYPRD